MMMIIIMPIILFLIFYFINKYLKQYENFCFGNVYCNGSTQSSLCVNQECEKCGIQATCKKDSDCGPNNCIDGCCDGV